MTSNKHLELSEKTDFLYQSISDIQSTIRAIDTKLGIAIAILSIPFTTISGIYRRFISIPQRCLELTLKYIAYAAFILFGVLWFISFIITLKGLVGLDNPALHVKRSNQHAKGTFYNGGLFKYTFFDNFVNRKSLCSTRCIHKQASLLPNTEDQLIQELAFEQMKLAYIRDMKQLRHKWSICIMSIWLFIGLFIYLLL